MSQLPRTQTLTLEFVPDAAGGTMIIWRGDFAGSRRTHFVSPYDDTTLPAVIRALDDQQSGTNLLRPEERQRLEGVGLWQNGQVPANAARIVGGALYQALGVEGQQTLAMIRNNAIVQRAATTYIMRFPLDAVHIAALPWELLHD